MEMKSPARIRSKGSINNNHAEMTASPSPTRKVHATPSAKKLLSHTKGQQQQQQSTSKKRGIGTLPSGLSSADRFGSFLESKLQEKENDRQEQHFIVNAYLFDKPVGELDSFNVSSAANGSTAATGSSSLTNLPSSGYATSSQQQVPKINGLSVIPEIVGSGGATTAASITPAQQAISTTIISGNAPQVKLNGSPLKRKQKDVPQLHADVLADLVQLNVVEVDVNSRKEIERRRKLKIEQDILSDYMLSEDARKIKLDNLRHSQLVDRVHDIIEKTRKTSSVKSTQTIRDENFERSLAVFKKLPSFIETKAYINKIAQVNPQISQAISNNRLKVREHRLNQQRNPNLLTINRTSHQQAGSQELSHNNKTRNQKKYQQGDHINEIHVLNYNSNDEDDDDEIEDGIAYSSPQMTLKRSQRYIDKKKEELRRILKPNAINSVVAREDFSSMQQLMNSQETLEKLAARHKVYDEEVEEEKEDEYMKPQKSSMENIQPTRTKINLNAAAVTNDEALLIFREQANRAQQMLLATSQQIMQKKFEISEQALRLAQRRRMEKVFERQKSISMLEQNVKSLLMKSNRRRDMQRFLREESENNVSSAWSPDNRRGRDNVPDNELTTYNDEHDQSSRQINDNQNEFDIEIDVDNLSQTHNNSSDCGSEKLQSVKQQQQQKQQQLQSHIQQRLDSPGGRRSPLTQTTIKKRNSSRLDKRTNSCSNFEVEQEVLKSSQSHSSLKSNASKPQANMIMIRGSLATEAEVGGAATITIPTQNQGRPIRKKNMQHDRAVVSSFSVGSLHQLQSSTNTTDRENEPLRIRVESNGVSNPDLNGNLQMSVRKLPKRLARHASLVNFKNEENHTTEERARQSLVIESGVSTSNMNSMKDTVKVGTLFNNIRSERGLNVIVNSTASGILGVSMTTTTTTGNNTSSVKRSLRDELKGREKQIESIISKITRYKEEYSNDQRKVSRSIERLREDIQRKVRQSQPRPLETLFTHFKASDVFPS